jgi:hypothetical protein
VVLIVLPAELAREMSVMQQTVNRAGRAAQDAGALLDSEIGAIVWLPGEEAVHICFGYPVRPAEANTVQLAGVNEAKNRRAVLSPDLSQGLMAAAGRLAVWFLGLDFRSGV